MKTEKRAKYKIDLDCELIQGQLDNIEDAVEDLYVGYFESPLDDIPKIQAKKFQKSLARIAKRIEEMTREVS